MIKKPLDKYFPKKFKVRVEHFMGAHFCTQYSYHRFLPNYIDIKEAWMSFSRADAELVHQTYLVPYSKAVKFAESFKTIEDVWEYNRSLEDKIKDIKIKVREEKKREIPHIRKQIL